MQIENLQKLFVEELKDVYDAEHQLVDALQEMAQSAKSSQLAKAFRDHRQETQGQIERLERIFRNLGQEAERKTCEGIKGLLEEGKEFMEADGDDATLDAALIGAAQKVEHYEIAAYGTLRTFAATLGRREEAQLLQEILDQESAADEKLSDIAVSGINPEATEGNGESTRSGGGRLASLLASLGIRSSSTSGRSGGGRSTGGRKAASRSGGSKSGAAKKSGATKKGAAKKGAAKKSASKRGASKGRATGGSKAAAKRSTGARKGATKRGANKSTASKGGARKGATKAASRSTAARKTGGSKSAAKRASKGGSRAGSKSRSGRAS